MFCQLSRYSSWFLPFWFYQRFFFFFVPAVSATIRSLCFIVWINHVFLGCIFIMSRGVLSSRLYIRKDNSDIWSLSHSLQWSKYTTEMSTAKMDLSCYKHLDELFDSNWWTSFDLRSQKSVRDSFHFIAEHKEGTYLLKLHVGMEVWNLCKPGDPSIVDKGEIQLTRQKCP